MADKFCIEAFHFRNGNICMFANTSWYNFSPFLCECFDILESAFQRRNYVKIENSPDRDFANKCHWGRKNWYFRIVRTGMYLIRKVTDVGYRWFERVWNEALYWTHQSWLKMTRGNIFEMRWISCRTQEWHNPLWNHLFIRRWW